MEIEQLEKLIKTVSNSSLTEFEYEEDGVKISMQSNGIKSPVAPAISLSKTEEEEEKKEESVGKIIKSPLVGTFYTAPAEDAKAFAAVGDEVKKGQTIGIIEAMKLMNDIDCELDGILAEIYVENGEVVEYGQPLFRVQ
ncbi:MAG: biotin/lipoyl-containing protein [Acetivibrio sp.]